MVGSYDYWLVLLSVVVAIMASYVGLDLASRVVASLGRRTRPYWLAGGAISLGTGIWAMHFIGMLAFRLPTPISYDVPITLLSLLIAIAASAFALTVASRATLSVGRLLASGVLLGIAIVSMHYTGMAAMRMDPPIRYQPFLFGLSILIAFAFSVAALWFAFRLRMETVFTAFRKKAGSAFVMGTAIYGMHYTGMAAARFAPNSICTVTAQDINQVGLAVSLGGFTLLFLTATLLISAFEAYLAERSTEHAESLRSLNAKLEQEVQARKQVEDALRQAQAALEARVAERTAELARSNQLLLEEIAERKAATERIRESEARLQAYANQLQALSRRLVEAEETYRRELARELHDRVGQNLAALNINLEILLNTLPPDLIPERAPRLSDSLALVDETVNSIEDVLSELRPPLLDDYGLLAALRWLAKQFTQRTGIQVSVAADEGLKRVDPGAEIALYRIAQEALTNLAKHAKARHVDISLKREPEGITLTIADDGIGFDPSTTARPDSETGWGMIGMRERAEAVGGKLTVDSAPGKGTRIKVTIAR